jgi:phosphoadenosine phosphosulfate reductase
MHTQPCETQQEQPLIPCTSTDEIASWNEQFRTASPQELLSRAAQRWGQHLAFTCSFGGIAGMVILDMLAQVAPQTPVLYIDTGLLFPETYALIEQVRRRYGIEARAVRPRRTVEQQARIEGPQLWERDPDRCCRLRKVEPLTYALAGFDAWISGVRRDSASTRAHAPLVEWSTKYDLVKLNPLAFWNERDVWRYIHEHNVPYNLLLDQGYRSLGCVTCTSLPLNDDPRSGRWAGLGKTECGLHSERA